jgi:hypothetical protein
MELSELQLILDQLEPGMSISVPKDWISLHVEGVDETERDLNTIEFVLERGCTWERDPDAKDFTFRKQPPAA